MRSWLPWFDRLLTLFTSATFSPAMVSLTTPEVIAPVVPTASSADLHAAYSRFTRAPRLLRYRWRAVGSPLWVDNRILPV